MKYIILDLDNCISDDEWRISRINWNRKDQMGRFGDYHILSAYDRTANLDLIHLTHTFPALVLTGRPLVVRASTEYWLRNHDVEYKHLLMRNNNDARPSLFLKRAMVEQLGEYGVALTDIAAAFDDHAEIVAMYRALGIRAHVRKVHDVCVYSHPQAVEHTIAASEMTDVLGAQVV